MADETPPKLIQIGPKGGAKKDGFNLVTERVVAVNPELKQLEVELLAYDGKTVVLDVDDEALAKSGQRGLHRRLGNRRGGIGRLRQGAMDREQAGLTGAHAVERHFTPLWVELEDTKASAPDERDVAARAALPKVVGAFRKADAPAGTKNRAPLRLRSAPVEVEHLKDLELLGHR